MASIKTRITVLEHAVRPAVWRDLTDPERAVRLLHAINHHPKSPVPAALRKFLNQVLGRDVLL